MSNLLNYTSGVPVEQSVSYIESMLAKAGAINTSKTYDGGVISGLWFQLDIRSGDRMIPMSFKLPVRTAAVESVLMKQLKRPRPETRKRVQDQAGRTAWKILSDWCEAQLAMIQLEQAEPLEIFLPYVYDPNKDRTFFQAIKAGGFKQIAYNPSAEKQ